MNGKIDLSGEGSEKKFTFHTVSRFHATESPRPMKKKILLLMNVCFFAFILTAAFGLTDSWGSVAGIKNLTLRGSASLNDKLIVDFGANGLWGYDGSNWSQLTGWSANTLQTWSGGLAVGFPTNGLWSYNGSGWDFLTTNNPEQLMGWSQGLTVDFGSFGLWNYDGSTWNPLTTWDPQAMEAWSGGLAVDFGASGLWSYDGSTWTLLTTHDAEAMKAWSGGLAVDFGTFGLWNYDGTNWTLLTTSDAAMMQAWDGGLAVDFSNGLWSYDGASWTFLTTSHPEGMKAWSNELAADFGTIGLWNYDGTSLSLLTTQDAQAMEGWVNGLAVDLGGAGFWTYDGANWSQLTTWDADQILTTTPILNLTPFSIQSANLMYRNFESGSNYFASIISITNNGSPVEATDITNVTTKNASGATLSSTGDGSYYVLSYWYDCSTGGCAQPVQFWETGAFSTFSALPAGSYETDITMKNGQTLSTSNNFPGQLVLPFVSSSTMEAQWNSGDLQLSWENPTADANWSEVDQLRIVLYDNSNYDTLYVAVAPNTNSVTIPAGLVAQAAVLRGGTGFASWQIQTRALDANNMNVARGYSQKVSLPVQYAVKFTWLMRNNSEDSGVYDQAVIDLSQNGGPISKSNITNVVIKNSSGQELTANSSGFYLKNYYVLNCLAGSCSPAGLFADSGYWGILDNMPADDYSLEVDMDNGQTLNASNSFPGPLQIPYVPGATMTSQSVGGDLQLSWSNPTSDPNWSDVNRLEVVLFDDLGNEVIYMAVSPTDNSVTLPAAWYAQFAPTEWQVQTRTYDANGLVIARGYSSMSPLP